MKRHSLKNDNNQHQLVNDSKIETISKLQNDKILKIDEFVENDMRWKTTMIVNQLQLATRINQYQVRDNIEDELKQANDGKGEKRQKYESQHEKIICKGYRH